MSQKNKKKKTGDYKVGYCKPPRETQWKKGESGNRKGRSPGSKSIKEIIHFLGNEMINVTIQGRTVKMTAKEAVCRRYWEKMAKDGDIRFFRDFYDIEKEVEERIAKEAYTDADWLRGAILHALTGRTDHLPEEERAEIERLNQDLD